MGRIRVFIATSLDGYIAGEGDDLGWLPTEGIDDPGEAVGFAQFMADVGAMVMGRRTYDVLATLDHPWAYGDTPVLVATHRELTGGPPTVRPVHGAIDAVLDEALAIAGERDVYIDGGRIVQQALAADRVDELIVTVVPVLLGRGVPLFGGLAAPMSLRFARPCMYGDMVQLRATRG